MLFWLTFIQSLPTISFPEVTASNLEIEENSPMNAQLSFVQTIEPVPVQPTMAQLGGIPELGGALFFPGLIVGLVVLLLISIWAYTRVYVITPNNEAFVRTGGVFIKGKKVIINGGCIVLPGFHELTRVPLREISIDVERTGALAVRTQDYLRANMRVTFYVCINAKQEDVLVSAARLSKQGRISEKDIKEALEKRADDAIRAAAKKKSLAEIDSDKLGFADEVLNLIQQDLKKVGLTLNNIAISEIEESDTYDENNFFDAQGVRLRTETIQRSIKQKLDVELTTLQEKKALELTTKVTVEQQELEAEKKSLTISQDKEDAKLTQQKEVESLKAQQQREIQEAKDKEAAKVERNKILQEKAVEEEKIQQQLAVQQSQIEADIALEERNKQLKVAQTLQKQEAEVAEITRQKTLEEEKIQQQLAVQEKKIEADIALEERNKELKIAQTLQKQEAEVAEINRQKTIDASLFKAQVEIAEAERESKTVQQEAAIAIAEKERDRFGAEAERAQAEASVVTATEVERAQREQRLSIIAAEQEAQQRRISDQNVVEIDVFRRRRQAEIARQAAELEAESIRTLAEANRYKAMAEAEGKRALIEAENALSDANRTAELIKAIWPELADKLPEIVKSLAPQPGILGDARIYAFPGASGNNSNGSSSVNDITKLLLSTSGVSLIHSLLDEGKLGPLISQVKHLLSSEGKGTTSPEALNSEVEASQEGEVKKAAQTSTSPLITPPPASTKKQTPSENISS
ncbi:MAG: flotillin domain-containing protein [Xenococcaceae cyanobacterium]